MVEGPPMVIERKALLKKLTFSCPQTVANQFMEYMLANFLLTQVVKNFLQGSTRDTSSKQKRKGSIFVKTSQETA